MNKAVLTDKDREESSRKLYEKIFSALNVKNNETILEVGCGQGEGVSLLARQRCTVYGMDISQKQINRCIDRRLDELFELKGRIKFFVGRAEEIPLTDSSIDKLFSLEAMQHFSSVSEFLKESYRVLRTEGKLVISTFLFKKPPTLTDLNEMITFTNGIDKAIVVNELKVILKEKGFKDICVKTIGKNVWEGFDKWISQTPYVKTWNRKWLQLYKNGVIDYYIVEAMKR